MGWFTGNDDVEKIIEEQIKNIKIIAEGLNLYLDKKIWWGITIYAVSINRIFKYKY